jgi:hypothetical protein
LPLPVVSIWCRWSNSIRLLVVAGLPRRIDPRTVAKDRDIHGKTG